MKPQFKKSILDVKVTASITPEGLKLIIQIGDVISNFGAYLQDLGTGNCVLDLDDFSDNFDDFNGALGDLMRVGHEIESAR